MPRELLALLIVLYQKTLSPDHGAIKPLLKPFFPHGFCRYHPSCSEYGRQAVLKYGVLRGSAKTLWRVLRCNPWSKGGVDEA
jgi:uncharacterized protein